MVEAVNRESGGRGSRDGWLEAAHRAFVRGGLDAVTIRNVSDRLRLSRSSVYWHFKHRTALLLALVGLWDARATRRLVAAAEAEALTETQAMLAVMRCFLDPDGFDQEFEDAMRSSGSVDAGIMRRVADECLEQPEALVSLMRRWDDAPERAGVRAQVLYLTQVGDISMQVRETTPRLRRLPHYVEVFSGRTPEEEEFRQLAESLTMAAGMNGSKLPNERPKRIEVGICACPALTKVDSDLAKESPRSWRI